MSLGLASCDNTKVVLSGKGGNAAGGSAAGGNAAGGSAAGGSAAGGSAAGGSAAGGNAAGGSAAGVGGAGGGSALSGQQARGQYLVDHVAACGDCHTPRNQNGPIPGKYLAGDPMFLQMNGDALGTRNLTNDATGLKNRSDAEIKEMFQNGLRPPATGTVKEPLNPFMPYYIFHNMTDADADAIVAYLRTVPAVVNMIPRRGVSFDVPAAAPALPLAKIPVPVATFPQKESAMRGRYLAAQAGVCLECHTKHLPPGSPTVLDEANLFAGGEDFTPLFANSLMIMPVSKNLTSDVTTGLGNWSVMDVTNAITMGKAMDGTGICPPMPAGPMGAFGGLSPADVADIANYIKSLPPIVNKITDICVFPPTGAGGAGGGAGAGGTTGAGGKGGTSGLGGTTGTAGTSGAAGKGGAGGAG